MFKGKRKPLTYLLVAILIFSIGLAIGVYSNGPTAIIDPTPGEGLSGFDWYNATTGVHAPDYYHETLGNYTAWIESIGGGVTDHGVLTGLEDDDHSQYLLQDGSEELTGHWDAGNYGINVSWLDFEELYRNGQNYTEWVESLGSGDINPEISASYIIFTEESTVKAKNGLTGEIDFTGTTSDVMNNVITSLSNGGKIVVKNGTYEIGKRTLLDSCDSGWVSADGNVVVSHDTGDKKEGPASVKLVVDGAFGTGLMAYYNFGSAQDISDYEAFGFWFKASTDLSVDAVEIVFDDDLNCASPELGLDVRHPEYWQAGVWKYINPPTDATNYHNPIDLSAMTSVQSIGLRAVVDPSACTLKMDEISIIDGSIRSSGTKPLLMEGAGINVTIFKMGDRVNNNMFFVTSDNFQITGVTFDGRLAYQDSIDGCTILHIRWGDKAVVDSCSFKNVKGCAVKFRDNEKGKVINCFGDSIENPFVSVSYSSKNKILYNYVKNITDDDPYWSIGDSCDNIIHGNTFEGPMIGNGIRIQGSSGYLSTGNIVSENNINNMAQSAIYVAAYAPHTVLMGNNINKCQRGIYGSSTSPYCVAAGNAINGSEKDGIDTNSGDFWTLSDNTVTDSNSIDSTHNGIRLYYSTNCSVTGNIIDDQRPSPLQCRAIREEGGDYNIIADNIAGATQYSPRILVVGEHTRVRDNLGFVTENWGTATISSSTSVQFNHGLSGTPDQVMVGFNTTGYGDCGWSATSTQITLTVTNSGTYEVSWYAIYKP